jgi:hypothetical protein
MTARKVPADPHRVAQLRRDPWRAKQLKKIAHALMQLELRGEGVVSLCHCGWVSKPTTTERRAHNAFARHKKAPNA